MTRKHFVAIAKILGARRYEGGTYQPVVDDLARDLADLFAEENEYFDRDRFLNAAGAGGVKA